MRKLWVARGSGDRGVIDAQQSIPWSSLVSSLTKTPKEAPDKKAIGWWTPAKFSGVKNEKGSDRWRGGFEHRDAITLDLDRLRPADIARVRATYAKFAYVMHSSYSHTEASPRLRIVLPLTRPTNYDEYQVVSRLIANRFDIELVDTISFRPVQVTYLPGRPPGGTYFAEAHEGAWVDVDAVLGELSDWRDFGQWPRSAREDARPTQIRAENPLEKRGIVGAFCRSFTIHDVIAKYELPYEPTSHPDRYTYALGHGIEGVVVYDDGLKAHSHHDTDPARGQNNAFDLVRLHKFSHLDAGVADDVPISKRPSYKEMAKLARSEPSVVAEIEGEAVENFETLPDLEEQPDDLSWLQLPGEDAPPQLEGSKKEQHPKKRARSYIKERYVYVRDQDGWAYRASPTLLLNVGAMKNSETCNMPRTEAGKRFDPVELAREIPPTDFHVDSRGYAPGEAPIYREVDGTTRLNLWTDPCIEELEPTADELERYNDLLDRVLGPFSVARDLYEQIMGYLVQNPKARIGYAFVLSGVPGCGKSTLTDYVPRLVFGRENVSAPENKQLRERFTGWALNARIISIAELWHADRRDAADFANSLKPYVTEPVINIERKGEDAFTIPNRASMFAQSNYRDCINLQDGDRRWFIHWCSAARFTEAEDIRYHDEFLKTDRAAGVLLYIFRRINVADFKPMRAPAASKQKLDLIADSLPEGVGVIREAIADQEPCFVRGVFLNSEIRSLLFRAGLRNVTDAQIGRWLRHEAIGATKLGKRRIGGQRPKVWTLNPAAWEHVRETDIAAAFDDLKPDEEFEALD
jgi:hypothetical protein